jgi:DNA-binding PadR family transcriptional regulator
MDALILQLISWVADRPRTYGEAMDAWKTSCPRMPVWEDAVSNGLVRVEGTGSMRERSVRLTQQGRALLDAQASAAITSQQTPGRRRATASHRA